MKIRTQFVLFNAVVVVSAAVLIAGAVFLLVRRMTIQTLQEEQDRQARLFAESCRQSVLQKNDIPLAGHVRILARAPGIDYAYFVGVDGRFRMHTDPMVLYKPAKDWEAARDPDSSLERREPVSLGSDTLGTAVVGFSRAHLDALIAAALRRLGVRVLMGTGAGVLLGLVIASALASHMTRPLREMARAAEEIGDGKFDARVNVRSAREVEALAASLNRMAAHLGRLDEVNNELIATVSHDLLSPLTAITTAGEYLAQDDEKTLTDDQRLCAAAITEKAMQVAEFARSLLDMVKVKGGKMRYHMAPVDVGDLVRRTVAFYRLSAEKAGVALNVSTPPMISVVADEEKIDRVLANLLGNAMKFAPRGTGRVDISVEKAADGGADVSVSDNGPGIPEDERALLFKAFSRVDVGGQKKRKIRGTGLGLSIAKSIVDAHGGRLEMEPAPGQGSRFRFHLPAAPPPGAA